MRPARPKPRERTICLSRCDKFPSHTDSIRRGVLIVRGPLSGSNCLGVAASYTPPPAGANARFEARSKRWLETRISVRPEARFRSWPNTCSGAGLKVGRNARSLHRSSDFLLSTVRAHVHSQEDLCDPPDYTLAYRFPRAQC